MALNKTFTSEGIVGKDGRKLTLTVSDELYSNSSSTNKSLVRWSLTTSGGWEYAQYYDTYCYLAINGQMVYISNGTLKANGYSGWITSNTGGPEGIWYDNNGVEYTCAKRGFSTSGQLDVVHDANGSKSITITFLVGIFYYVVKDCGGTFTLNSIDRSGPTINQESIRNTTYNSCYISAIANVNCNSWFYRKRVEGNDWGNWSSISGTGLAKQVTVTGLTPNTSYEFQFQASKASNGVSSTSGTRTTKTLGASILNSITKDIILLDSNNPQMSYNLTSYSTSFYHKLVLYNGSSNLTFNLGANNYSGSVSLNKNTLLNWIGNTFSKTGLYASLFTYGDSGYSNQIGNASTISGISIKLDKSIAGPTLTIGDPPYVDVNTGTKYIDVGSNLRLNSISASGNMGAKISSLTVKLGNTTRNLTLTSGAYSGNYTWGNISSKAYGLVEITAIDTRGLKVTLPIMLYINTIGDLVKDTDYNAWYDILDKHYSGIGIDNKYYVSGTTSKQFHLSRAIDGNLAKASDITFGDSPTATIAGIAGAVSRLPHAEGDYYDVKSADIEAISNYIANVLAGNRTLVINSSDASVTAGKTLTYNGSAVSVNTSSKTATITQQGDLNIEDLIMSSLNAEITAHMNSIDQVVLFNLVEGE